MSQRPPATRIIAVMNQKGGVGKTTSTVNLGAAMAEAGRKVLLVDLDPQAHLTIHVGLDPTALEATLYDLMTDDAITAEAVIAKVGENLWALPAEVDLAGLDQELASHNDRQQILKRKLASLKDRYDVILLDCPPSLGLLTLNAMAFAGEVIVPMQAHFLALQGLSKLLETVQLVRQRLNSSLRVSGVILCLHDSQTNLAAEVVADLDKFFNASRKLAMPWSQAVIYQPPIRRNIKLAECPSFGQTIFQYAPWCPGARDYQSLAEAVMAHSPGAESAIPKPPARTVQTDPAPAVSPGSGPATDESLD